MGLRPSRALKVVLDGFSDSDVAKLVYRDNIKVKHGGRKRLAEEISSKPPVASLRANKDALEDRDEAEPLSKALVAYLLEVGYTSHS